MSLLRKLNEDERGIFRDFIVGPEFDVVIKVLDEILIEDKREQLLKISIDGTEKFAQKLIVEKTEIQGAEKLLVQLERFKDALTKKKET